MTETFEALRNFRDCGGDPTIDGRIFRKGKLYRSAQHAELSERDLDKLSALGISAIVDLRRPDEREKCPSRRWPGFAGRVVEHFGLEGIALPPHLAAFADAGSSAAAARSAMLEIYKGFPYDPMLIELYRDFFALLAETDGAVLIHCAAGKDRTGFGVALAQHLAGMNRDAIVAQFLKTNQSDLISEATMAAMKANAMRDGVAFSDDAIVTVLTVEPEYLDASFAVIERRNGSIDEYLHDVLGVTPARYEAIRERLIEG
ncbi:MAG TPA: tyrosine-protein phosphatase [Rhizomicrobium sp.]|jgi:protein tyrosine/serine phosphatase